MEIAAVTNLLTELGIVVDLSIAIVTIVFIHKIKPILKKYHLELLLHLSPLLVPSLCVFVISSTPFEFNIHYGRIWLKESLFAMVSTYALYELFWKKFIEKKTN